jgi:hypothetical protein
MAILLPANGDFAPGGELKMNHLSCKKPVKLAE